MQFSTIIAILAPLSAVQAGCFSSFQWFADSAQRDAMSQVITRICTEAGVSGYFEVGQHKDHCENASGTLKYDFAVTWTQDYKPADPLSDTECVLRLSNELYGCEAGGESVTGGYRFKTDANEGQC